MHEIQSQNWMAQADKISVNSQLNTPMCVDVPWSPGPGGNETLVVGKESAFKRFSIAPQQCLSLQVHIWKQEIYRVLLGDGKLIYGWEGEYELTIREGDSVVVPPGIPHQALAGSRGLVVAEASTPEITDNVRIADNSGRPTADVDEIRGYIEALYGHSDVNEITPVETHVTDRLWGSEIYRGSSGRLTLTEIHISGGHTYQPEEPVGTETVWIVLDGFGYVEQAFKKPVDVELGLDATAVIPAGVGFKIRAVRDLVALVSRKPEPYPIELPAAA